jgi:hypothetical protein
MIKTDFEGGKVCPYGRVNRDRWPDYLQDG